MQDIKTNRKVYILYSCNCLLFKQEQNEIADEAVVEVAERTPTTVQKNKKIKIRNANVVAEKILLKKKHDDKKQNFA